MLYENRLDDVIDFDRFVDNEQIEIRTKMGNVITCGNVQSVTPFGIIIKENNGNIKFYSDKLYLFAQKNKEPEIDTKQLNDMSLDDRIKNKLAAMSEAGDPIPDNTSARPMDKEYKKDDSKDDDIDKKYKDQEKENGNIVDIEKSIDVNDLPRDIKDAIISPDEMDESKLNGVLGEISDASLKSLKRAGINDTEIFGLVQKINNAIYKILTGKKPKKK